RDKSYDKAADAIDAIVAKFPDIPPEELLEITSSAARNASAKSAARLIAIHRATARKAANAKKLRTLRVQLKKTPADKDLIRRYAELTAADGDWGNALKVFARLGGVVGKMAQDELDNSAESSASLAAFWWNYKPIENTVAAAIRRHAAAHYQAALDAAELSGLEITLAERRIAEAQPEGEAQIASGASATPQNDLAARTTSAPTQQYKFEYKLDDKGDAILTGITPRPEGVVVCPESIDGHVIKDIADGLFSDKVTRIVLPAKLERISFNYFGWPRPGAIFSGCTSLASIEIAASNPAFASKNGVLYSKDMKRLIAYPKTRSEIKLDPKTVDVAGGAFQYCSFKAAKLPDTIEACGFSAFGACPNLEVIEFPRGFKHCGVFTVEGCPNLRRCVFHGDAPGAYVRRTSRRENVFFRSTQDIIVEVEKGSKGWAGPGSTTLPARWPLDGSDSRPIRYIGDVPPYRKAGVTKGWKVEVAVGYFTGNVPNEQFLDSGNNASDAYPVIAFSAGVVGDASAITAERVSFPGNPGDARFTSRSKGTMRVPAAGDWTFAVQCDDGYRVKISGNGFFSSFSGGHTHDKAICHTVTLPAAGDYEVEILHSNIGGPAYLDFSAAKGRFTDFQPSEFKLVGDPTGQIKMATPGK
ncbi:MAG: leucine-rich repeat protein, partial [Kiritimatiellae bacterium]|nr:leucine-rich repeat protein [Kiritimatiellia bacterium]